MFQPDNTPRRMMRSALQVIYAKAQGQSVYLKIMHNAPAEVKYASPLCMCLESDSGASAFRKKENKKMLGLSRAARRGRK